MLHSELLAQIPLFDTLAPEDLEALGQRMTERSYKAGERVFAQGDKCGGCGTNKSCVDNNINYGVGCSSCRVSGGPTTNPK